MYSTDNYSFDYKRFSTREVFIGKIPMGANNPVRIQSMTNTNTLDTKATVNQCLRLIEAGCEYIRITAQGIKEAYHLETIKNELFKKGYSTPLIADIHFNPKAAEISASIVEKVRINPGNYIDRNKMSNYSEVEYNDELKRVSERLLPLIEICKKSNTAIRVGTNHGSLSYRILNRYGDTPRGMVESTMEFIRIFDSFKFHNLVLSMKSSNVKVMIASNRLLVENMIAENFNFPIHLGVTEAGNAEDGRIKSAAGIGVLLKEGIGDTVRVSLTEAPEFEIPVAKKIVESSINTQSLTSYCNNIQFSRLSNFSARKSRYLQGIGGKNKIAIVGNSTKADFIFKNNVIKSNLNTVLSYKVIEINNLEFLNKNWEKIKNSFCFEGGSVILLNLPDSKKAVENLYSFFTEKKIDNPIIFKKTYDITEKELFNIKATIDFNYILVDGNVDGIMIENPYFEDDYLVQTSLDILQSGGYRISKAEYIACPSCGRTQFDIEASLNKVKEKTKHLRGIKIAVMGCIVNGPGEMADADYGYVGSGSGKVTIYKSKEVVEKNLPEDAALTKLIELIKKNGDWVEKEN